MAVPRAPRSLTERVKGFLRKDLSEIVLSREIGGEEYRTRTGLRLVQADRESTERFCRDQHPEWPERAQLWSYLANHYRGVYAELDGKLIGHVWYCDSTIPTANRHPHLSRFGLDLAAGEVWSFDLFIAPEHRGGGTANDFFVLFRQHLERAGYTRVYGHVNATNLPAVWLHKVQGYKPVKTITSKILARRFLLTGKHLYIRNPTVAVRQRFDYHRLM